MKLQTITDNYYLCHSLETILCLSFDTLYTFFFISLNIFIVVEVLYNFVPLKLFCFTDMKCGAKSEYYTHTSVVPNLFDRLLHITTTYYLLLELLSASHLLQMQDAHYLTEFCV